MWVMLRLLVEIRVRFRIRVRLKEDIFAVPTAQV